MTLIYSLAGNTVESNSKIVKLFNNSCYDCFNSGYNGRNSSSSCSSATDSASICTGTRDVLITAKHKLFNGVKVDDTMPILRRKNSGIVFMLRFSLHSSPVFLRITHRFFLLVYRCCYVHWTCYVSKIGFFFFNFLSFIDEIPLKFSRHPLRPHMNPFTYRF